MPATLKILGQSSPLSGSLTTLYTTPSATTTVVSSAVICNQNSNASSFRLAVQNSGSSISPEHYLFYDTPIFGNETQVYNIGLTLAATDVISCYATTSSISFNIFGQQNT